MSLPQILLLSFHSDTSLLSSIHQSICTAFPQDNTSTFSSGENGSRRSSVTSSCQNTEGSQYSMQDLNNKDTSSSYFDLNDSLCPQLQEALIQIKTKYYIASAQLKSFYFPSVSSGDHSIDKANNDSFMNESIKHIAQQLGFSIVEDLSLSSVEALVVITEQCQIRHSKIEDTNQLKLIDLLMMHINPAIRILSVTISENKTINHQRSSLLNWSLERQFELIFPFVLRFSRPNKNEEMNVLKSSLMYIEQDNNVNDHDEVSVERIIESLTCHQWPGLKRIEINRNTQNVQEFIQNSVKRFAENQATDRKQVKPIECEAQTDVRTYPRSNSDTELKTSELVISRTESICSEENIEQDVEGFDKLLQKIQQVRENAISKSMDDAERREIACKVAMELFNVLELEDDA